MVSMIVTGSEDSGFRTACPQDSSITLSVHPTVNEYLTIFRAEEVEGGEEEEWRPHRSYITAKNKFAL